MSTGTRYMTTREASHGMSIVGVRFGRLLVLSERVEVESGEGKTRRMAVCKCECGAEKAVRRGGLLSGQIRSCGCWRREYLAEVGRAQQARNRELGLRSFNQPRLRRGETEETAEVGGVRCPRCHLRGEHVCIPPLWYVSEGQP